MKSNERATTLIEIEKLGQIPSNFPVTALLGAISGAQAKLTLTEFGGKFYSPGTSPPERFQRWDICEDLARQFSKKSLESKSGKRSHLSEVEILQQYYERLLKTGWVSDVEAIWVMHRVASILSWPNLVL